MPTTTDSATGHESSHPTPDDTDTYPTVKRPGRRGGRWVAGLLLALVLAGAAIVYQQSPGRGVVAKTEIYRGVTYEAFSAEGGGLVHWVTVDTQAPGVAFVTTPLDPAAVKAGWQYKLQFTTGWVQRNGLAVGINGGFFNYDSRFAQWPGDFAVTTGTAVSGGVWAQGDPDTYILWIDKEGKPHWQLSKPPWPAEVKAAQWAVSSQMPLIAAGKINASARTAADNWTAIATSSNERYLHMVVSSGLSEKQIAERMVERGCDSAISMDAGDSSAMTIGANAKGVRPGRMLWEWRPVATHLGVRADPLP